MRSDALEAKMKERGVNGKRLAELTGLSANTIAAFRGGRVNPKRAKRGFGWKRTALKIASALESRPEDLWPTDKSPDSEEVIAAALHLHDIAFPVYTPEELDLIERSLSSLVRGGYLTETLSDCFYSRHVQKATHQQFADTRGTTRQAAEQLAHRAIKGIRMALEAA